MSIKEIARSSKNSFSFELMPPLRGKPLADLLVKVRDVMYLDPKFITVTSHRTDTRYVPCDGLFTKVETCQRPGTVAMSARLQSELGVPVVPHIVCAGNSKQVIENELIDLQMLGIDNLLVLRGDKDKQSTSFQCVENGYSHATQLMEQISDYNCGCALTGKCQPGNFHMGVACYPEKHEESMNIQQDDEWLKHKILLGAEFGFTQMCFSDSRIMEYIDKIDGWNSGFCVIPGIKVLSKLSQLTTIPRIFHCDFPEEFSYKLLRCTTDEEVRKVGIDHAAKMVKNLYKAGIPLVHFYTTNSLSEVTDVMTKVMNDL